MMKKLYHLDCGPVRPLFPPVASSTLCTLVHAAGELILVDTGLGTRDLAAPSAKMRVFTALMRAKRDVANTAYHQIQALGYRPTDVRHILCTHLHLDHNGGLPDFPDVLVHVYRPEHEAATGARGLRSLFYEPRHWEHGPRWRLHQDVEQDGWFGFDAIEVREIASTRVLMIPLVGHSPGHSGVAIQVQGGWVFHCGGALPFGGLDSEAPDWISSRVIGPHAERIRRLAREHRGEIQVVNSHMPLGGQRPADDVTMG
jgi:glyoxylase-like metal-dependent hydrolase (beta-lactamase superfamily II)